MSIGFRRPEGWNALVTLEMGRDTVAGPPEFGVQVTYCLSGVTVKMPSFFL